MLSRKLAALCCFVLLSASLVLSQTPEAQSKRADIIRLLRLTGAAGGAEQAVDLLLPMLKQAMPQVPPQVWQELRSEVREDDMIELTYQIWDRHFTQQEIRDLLRFYQSPVGQKIIRETPALQQESLAAGQKWGGQILARLVNRLREKGYQVPANLQQQP